MDADERPTLTVGEVIGLNLKRLRELSGMTQREYVAYLRSRDLKWTQSKLSSFESGRQSDISLTALLRVALAIGVPVKELTSASDDLVLVIDDEQLEGSVWNAITTTNIDARAEAVRRSGVDFSEDLESPTLDAETRLAGRLGTSVDEIVDLSVELWGRTLTLERNRRVSSRLRQEPLNGGGLGFRIVDDLESVFNPKGDEEYPHSLGLDPWGADLVRRALRGRVTRELANELDARLRQLRADLAHLNLDHPERPWDPDPLDDLDGEG
jgi:transcriptional regulator with XRE-family HTH domain